MQNRTNSVDVFHIPDLPPDDFPISYPAYDTHSPSSNPINNIHFHDSIEIGYCYEGNGIFYVDGKLFSFSTGDVSLILKSQLHIAQSDRTHISKWRFIQIVPELLLADLSKEALNNISSIWANTELPNVFTFSLYPRICQLVLAIIDELQNRKLDHKSYVKSLVWQFFIEMERISSQFQISKPLLNGTFQPLTPALDYISNHYMNHIDVSILADLCHTSERNLRRLFVKSLNISPLEYLIKFRVHIAASLLRTTNDSILNISCSVGFISISSFNRHFIKLMGVSPKKWRMEN